MTDSTGAGLTKEAQALVERLRGRGQDYREFHGRVAEDYRTEHDEAADLIEAQAAEIERLRSKLDRLFHACDGWDNPEDRCPRDWNDECVCSNTRRSLVTQLKKRGLPVPVIRAREPHAGEEDPR